MEQRPTPSPLYTIQPISGKGLGLVAATKIAKGTRILAEPPLLRLPNNVASERLLHTVISDRLSLLPEPQRQAFYSLHNIYGHEHSKEIGIARTNALPLGSNTQAGGLFIKASRINHACNQNAQNTWNDILQVLTIHATRDIEQGGEITISYLNDHSSRASRQRQLQTAFRFACSCDLCTLHNNQRQSSDKRREEIRRLDGLIGIGPRILSHPLQALHDVQRLLDLLREEGITDASVPRAYYDAFQVAIIHGDLARAKVFAERACSARAIVEGHDSPEVKRLGDLAKTPSQHMSHGVSRQWRTRLDDFPAGLDASGFENWLWRRERRETSHNAVANLRNEVAFPSFRELPGDNDIDLEYFHTVDGFTYRPQKHWCFLAEIIDVEIFLRLRLIVKDRTGRTIPIAFHTDYRGQEVVPQLQQGYTVAILYAEQHGFMDFTVGIRHETPETLKVFPLKLDDLLLLNDRVQKYAISGVGEGMCHGCDQKKSSLKRCAKCSFFGYCDKSCQAVGWKEKGHKGDCKLLKDADLRGLFHLDWDKFEKHHQFS